jgi:aryl-alcohol dehydrogenase-like predicted oxidoreductase
MMSSTPLERRPLGRDELKTTVMGYGAGGRSRAGLDRGVDHAASVVTAALEAGINVIDTAEAYRTEPAVAMGIARSAVRRDDVIVTTKVGYRRDDELRSVTEVRNAVLERLEALGTDYLDVIQLHGVQPDDYTWARDELLPEIEKLRQHGVVRSIGLTEMFAHDGDHRMLEQAVADGCWDTVMVGYNLINSTARNSVIAAAERAGIGVLVMFAVRDVLTDIGRLADYLRAQSVEGRLPAEFDIERTLGRLRGLLEQESITLTELAYRFAATPDGVSTVLVGTGNPAHLAANRAAFHRPRLEGSIVGELDTLFAGVRGLTGDSR